MKAADIFRQKNKYCVASGAPLQRRLFMLFALLTAVIIAAFWLLLVLFDITGSGKKAVHNFLDTELNHLSAQVSADFGALSVKGVSMSEQISKNAEAFFEKNDASAEDLKKRPQLIEPLLAEQTQLMKNLMDNNPCSGVFIMLDATVNPTLEGAQYSRAGIFLKRTQPNSVSSVGSKILYLRGPASIARSNGIELLGQWKMEYDTEGEEFFGEVMKKARENPTRPLSRLYYWNGAFTLKDNSESGFVLCVPIRCRDGSVIGLCGMEVSDRFFKHSYSPNSSIYESVFSSAAPCEGHTFGIDRGLIAGNYYLTGFKMKNALDISDDNSGFSLYSGDDGVFGGIHRELAMYPQDSPYADRQWALAVMMPHDMLKRAVDGNNIFLIIIVLVLLAGAIVASIFISRHYIRPVTDAFASIKKKNYMAEASSAYLEINDLMEYLASQDEEIKNKDVVIHDPSENINDMFDEFINNIKTLSPAERNVFNMYIKGYRAQEIADELHLSINTIKTHNRRIFAKLNVSTRKELLVYIDMMKEMNMIGGI